MTAEVTVNGFTQEEFLTYLENVLIPDLREDGRDATADDFDTAISFLRAGERTLPAKEEKRTLAERFHSLFSN